MLKATANRAIAQPEVGWQCNDLRGVVYSLAPLVLSPKRFMSVNLPLQK